jgi:N-methylhydantoinase A
VDREASVVNTRVAIDIGGTFTDLVATDGSGNTVSAKADTTPAGLDRGVLAALDRSGVPPGQVTALVHGTTVVINAVTERTGVPTALLTTAGFRDVLLIGRANRPDLYNLAYRKPEPFVPRRWCFEVTERMSHRGEVITPLRDEEVLGLAAELEATPVRAVAVCLLHAWRDPRHERRAAALLRERLPGVTVVASHEVSGEWREYERASTSVLSAYVQPVVAGYLGALADSLTRRGACGDRYAMRSSGGVCSFGQAASAPVTLLESGPAAGVTAAAELGRRIGARHVLTLDIGGTTAKTSAVRDGRVRVNTLHHVAATPAFAGYPVQVPVVDIVEIGAGGGSIAHADAAGGLRIGPQSAGADPGPACYGRGGTRPTLTDANLVAGRLDPEYFLGGSMPLDTAAARDALGRLGGTLGVDADAAARGALRCAIAAMSHALRLVTLRRGHDPRDFTFVAYGGAGPLHAAVLARELGIRRTVIPPRPGHFSAFGMLAGGLRADAARTVVGPLDGLPLAPVLDSLAAQAAAGLGTDGGTVSHYLGLRYQGQEHTIEVPLPDGQPEEHLAEIGAAFERLSLEAYSFRLDAPLEVVSARVTATAQLEPVSWTADTSADASASRRAAAPGGSRPVDFDTHGGVQQAAVLPRAGVPCGGWQPGPCVVEEPAATALVLPGQAASADELGNLIIEER